MQKPPQHDSANPAVQFCSRVCHRAVATALVPLLAATTSLLIPASSAAAARHTAHHRAVSHTATRHTGKRPSHRGASSSRPAASSSDSRGETALRFAISQLGKPYRWGGTGPNSYDCSGLVQRAWRVAGVRIPRTTQEQARFGTAVPMSRIRPGDLVIFYSNASHVGIYAGHGKVIVAPRPGKVISYAYVRWMPVYGVRRPG